MKKRISVFFAAAALLMLTVPAKAAIPDRGEPPADGQYPYPGSIGLSDPSASPTPEQPAEDPPEPIEDPPEPVDVSSDVPVDESFYQANQAYQEETPAPYTPPQRLPGQGEISDILQYWEDNGYPDYVSYAFETGGEVADDGTIYSYWEIGLVDADEAQKQEILGLIHPSCLVEFKTCLFTHAQKQTAYDTITGLAKTDENILEVIFIRNGDSVWVSVPEELTKDYAEYLIRDLDLGAVVSVTDQHSISYLQGGLEHTVTTPGMGMDTAGAPPIPAPIPAPDAPGGTPAVITGGESGLLPAAPEAARISPVFGVYFAPALALALAAACAFTALALRRRLVPAAVTRDGAVRISSAPLTRREAERVVEENLETPDASVYRAILEQAERDDPKA